MFEYVNVSQTMSTQDALLLMDQEVDQMQCKEDSLSLDAENFSQFYCTFDGDLRLKSKDF